jgi:hypothetical protein
MEDAAFGRSGHSVHVIWVSSSGKQDPSPVGMLGQNRYQEWCRILVALAFQDGAEVKQLLQYFGITRCSTVLVM